MKRETVRDFPISEYSTALKKLIQIFKQGNWNNLQVADYVLLQEADTRFGTFYPNVASFLKSAQILELLFMRRAQRHAGGHFRV